LQLYDYAVPNEDYTQFTPLGMTDVVKPNGTFCFGLVNNSITYFPIGLQENWENAPFISTYFPAEVFYLFFGAIMYLLVLAFTMYHFAVHIRMREVGRPFFNLSTAALLILIIFLMSKCRSTPLTRVKMSSKNRSLTRFNGYCTNFLFIQIVLFT
jgi:hypothetical protein